MNTVKDIQNKLKSSLGYNVASNDIKRYLAEINIQVSSLNSDVTDDEITRGVAHILNRVVEDNDVNAPSDLAVVENTPLKASKQPKDEITVSDNQLQKEIKVLANNMQIEIVEADVVDMAENTANIFTNRKEMLAVLGDQLRRYVQYQLSQDENAFKNLSTGISNDVKSSNQAVVNMVHELQREVEAGNQALKRGIDRMRNIFAVPTK